jgi:hypothetical protein
VHTAARSYLTGSLIVFNQATKGVHVLCCAQARAREIEREGLLGREGPFNFSSRPGYRGVWASVKVGRNSARLY